MTMVSRIINSTQDCYSSGSEHEEELISSNFLAKMVNEFIEEDEEASSVSECRDQVAAAAAADEEWSSLSAELHLLLHQKADDDDRERKLLADVLRAKDQAEKSGLDHQRAIVGNLRCMRYNAAVCKSRWNQSKGISQGEYTYIDVLLQPDNQRFIVDTEFSMQFEIARPSEQYLSIFSHIPPVFVGTPHKLQTVLRIISDAMKLSLKRQDLLLPPWRKTGYLKSKWFSTYRRTTNPSSKHSAELVDWELPLVSRSTAAAAAARGPGLAKLLTEAGLLRRNQAHPLVTVAM